MKKMPNIENETLKVILVIILIIFSINGIIFIGKFIGYASYSTADAGTITEIDINYREPAWDWAGLYGLMFTRDSFNSTQTADLDPAEVEEKIMAFECFPGSKRYVFVTMVPSDDIDWGSITPGTAQDIDDYLGMNGSEMSSAENTFKDTFLVELGGNSYITPAVYTYVYDSLAKKSVPGSTNFGTGVLIDSEENLIFVTDASNYVQSFLPAVLYDYQMILPISNRTTVRYYFTSNPLREVCPKGEGIVGKSGWVEGYVKDGTGFALNGTFVAIGEYNTLTDITGFYRLEAPARNATINVTIVGVKETYENYVGTVNVTADNTTRHDFSMVKKTEYTGPGQTEFTNVDIGPGQSDGDGDGDGDGNGIGPGIGPYLEAPKEIEGKDFVVSIPQINRRIKTGSYIEEIIDLYSFKENTVTLEFEVTGSASKLIELDKTRIILGPKSRDSITLRIFGRGDLGMYNGSIKIGGSINEEIPVRIEHTDKDLLDIQTLFIDLDPVQSIIHPGEIFKHKTVLRNLLTDRAYPVNLVYTITDTQGREVISVSQDNVNLKTTFSLLKSENIPKTAKPGDYILTLHASYLELTSTVSTVFRVTLPFYQYMVFGKIPLWWIMIAILIILILTGLGYWYYKNLQSKKKFHLKVDYGELPKPGPRNVYVGKIAETDKKTYFNLENFKVHTIVAGSTGGGKSFAAQGIIEEMLLHDVAVIVFDPTAQWTGFLRKLTAKSILALYSIFGMKPTEAKAFGGNIRQINDARELIEIKKYMKPGEIQVFACHKLDPKDIDIYVANAIREVFHANFNESRELRLMLVFDEVHRLLPKFGGSGEGFLQIERGCREFRKWGIGIMLISQVLNDFMGQIKANINTEIQMRTRDEGDLDRIATRYGKEVLQSLVKATVGSGMVENPAYNRGKPYFISFKPIRHSVERLTDEEIEKYNTYNEQIDQMQFELDALEEKEGQDVFDLKLELKLALDKVKSGNFNMVDIYVEGIKPRIKAFWEKLEKPAPILERKMVNAADLKAELEKAKAEKEKIEQEEKSKEGSKKEEEKEEEKEKTSFELRTEFRDALNFANGAQITTLQELIDVLPTMDANIFSKTVNNEKNDLEDWVRNKLGVPSLADKLRDKKSRDEAIKVIEEEQKKPTKIKPKPKEKKVEIIKTEKVEETKEVKEETKTEKEEEKVKEETRIKEKPWPKIKAECEKLSSTEDKIRFLTEKEKSYPKDANIKYTLGILYHKMKKYHNAKIKYEQTLRILPNNEKVKEYLIKINEKLDQKNVPSPKELIEKELPPEKYFRLADGREIKSSKELRNIILEMNDDEVKQYVNEEKNDFANWAEYALGNKGLADRLKQAHNKSELEKVLT